MSDDPSARRPLKSRSTGWARGVSRLLLRLGLSPNQVSVLSILCAAAGGACMILAVHTNTPAWWWGAAAGIQLRLLCNLMDGMLAVEGGLKTPTGELYNEFPDRLSDALLLITFGCAGQGPWAMVLGGVASAGALMTACIRLHGASLTGAHDFRGPMAKPHRMAVLTVACIILAFVHRGWIIPSVLGLIVAGCGLTCCRRLRALAATLHSRAPRP